MPGPQPRAVGRIQWLGAWTLFLRELRRYFKEALETVLAPAFQALVYFVVLIFALGPDRGTAEGNALLSYAALTGSDRHRRAAEECLATLAPLFGRHARFAGWALAVAEALVAGPAEVVVLDRPDLLAVARLATAPGAVVAVNGPLAEGRAAGAAYVCRQSVCELPTTDAERLREQLAVRV